MAASQDEPLMVICTASGMKTVSLFSGDEVADMATAADDLAPTGFCPLCPLAQAVAVLPGTVFVPAVDLTAHPPQAPPADPFVAVRPAAPFHARAPPSFG